MFPSRPGFVFYDAKGFEIESTEAGDAAVGLLAHANNSVTPEQQIHAVW